MKTHFKQLFEYDKWACQALLGRFEKQFPVNPRIYELLSHTLSAQKIWLDRVLGLPQTEERFQARLPDEIKEDLKNYHIAWLTFIDQLQASDFDRAVQYTTFTGQQFDSKLGDIITQVLNHGTHHRGGIMILMKEEGFVLPNIDFISFVRQ